MNKSDHINNLIHYKKRVILTVDDSVSPFVILRRLSTISPRIATFINQAFNDKQDFYRDHPQLFYDALLHCFPKLNNIGWLEFPPVLRETNKQKPSSEELEVAHNMEISVRELRDLMEDDIFKRELEFSLRQ